MKLPICKKETFSIWKQRVRLFMEALYPRIYVTVKDGPYTFEKASTIDLTRKVAKTFAELTKDEVALFTMDKRAQNIIVNAIDDSTFQNLVHCTIAKEMWDTLIVYMEGTTEVRGDRKSLLNQEYEAFRKHSQECISDCYERFFRIINELRTYGRIFSDYELNDKFLRSLTRDWDTKI